MPDPFTSPFSGQNDQMGLLSSEKPSEGLTTNFTDQS